VQRISFIFATVILVTGAVNYAQTPPLAPSGLDTDEQAQWTPWIDGRYRLTPGDVLDLRFPFVPELDQTLTIQPDGYVTLREGGELRFQGRTVPEARLSILEAYSGIVRSPVLSLTLKEFEKPYFIASGQVTRPGKYELGGATTVTQALALAGGFNSKAKPSQVVIFRRLGDGVTVRELDVKKMYANRDLSEDPFLRPGDMLFVPQSGWSRVTPFIPIPGVGLYGNPFRF
jgi:polysaccharide export outer membrane protein